MLSSREGQISRWIIVVNLDVRSEPRPRPRSFDEVVTEKRVLWKPPVSCFFESVDVVNPFTGEAPLTVEILVYIGHGSCVGIHAGVSGVD